MNPAIIEKLIDLFKSVANLSEKVVEQSDPEKYAKSVNELSQGVDNTYDQMRKIIIESDKFTDAQKLKKLKKLAEQEMETKKKCDEAIKGNREHVAKIALELVKGFLTCGVSFAPSIVKEIKSAGKNQKELIEVETPLLETENGSK